MFRDRTDAGRQLAGLVASRLTHPSRSPGVEGGLVLGLPRGGVPVGAMVAQALGVPLDVLVVRKIGAPWQPELALGAVGEHGAVALNEDVARAGGMADDDLDAVICVSTPMRFSSVGQHYEQFEQVSIASVRQLLEGSPA